MTKKMIHYYARPFWMNWFLVRTSSMLVFIPLSLLLILCTACGGTNSTSTSSSTFHTTFQSTDKAFTVRVTITPDQAGNNTFIVELLSPQQHSLQNVQVDLQTTMLDMAMGTDSLVLHAGSQRNFSGQGILAMSGHWQIRVVIRTSDHRVHEGQFQTILA